VTDPAEVKREAQREYLRKWRAANAEKVRAQSREYLRKWRAANLEKSRKYQREWRSANPEARAEAKRKAYRKWYASNHDKKRSAVKAWQVANPEKKRGYARVNRQHRRASCTTSTGRAPTAKQIKALLARPCHYCGEPSAHVDHYVPLARGGTHTLDNLRPACALCNTSKGAKLPGEWKGRRKC
jgi:5-methylcytosine-specific restriction endonuclease McrA